MPLKRSKRLLGATQSFDGRTPVAGPEELKSILQRLEGGSASQAEDTLQSGRTEARSEEGATTPPANGQASGQEQRRRSEQQHQLEPTTSKKETVAGKTST